MYSIINIVILFVGTLIGSLVFIVSVDILFGKRVEKNVVNAKRVVYVKNNQWKSK